MARCSYGWVVATPISRGVINDVVLVWHNSLIDRLLVAGRSAGSVMVCLNLGGYLGIVLFECIDKGYGNCAIVYRQMQMHSLNSICFRP